MSMRSWPVMKLFHHMTTNATSSYIVYPVKYDKGFGGFILMFGYKFYLVLRDQCQIAKTLGSTSIWHRSDTFASDRCLTDIEQKVFAIWDPYALMFYRFTLLLWRNRVIAFTWEATPKDMDGIDLYRTTTKQRKAKNDLALVYKHAWPIVSYQDKKNSYLWHIKAVH